MAIAICDNCGNDFERPLCHIERSEHNFCSQGCYFTWRKGENNPMYGRKRPDIQRMLLRDNPAKKSGVRKKISEARKGQHNSPATEFKKGITPWNKGVPAKEWMTEKGYKRMMTALKESAKYLKGPNHPNWQGGKTEENIRLRNSEEYKEWKMAVLRRDNFTCQQCRSREHGLVAHHIKDFAEYPELRFDVDNGLTLCRACHNKLHFGGGD